MVPPHFGEEHRWLAVLGYPTWIVEMLNRLAPKMMPMSSRHLVLEI
jgi:hypothetical protein